MEDMVSKNLAAYEPPKQSKSSVLLYWRSPEEWAGVLHDWVRHPYRSIHICIHSVLPCPFLGEFYRSTKHDHDIL